MSAFANWQAVAERAARMRCNSILATIETAVAEHAGSVDVETRDDAISVRGRGLKAKWLSEPGLRFARRIRR